MIKLGMMVRIVPRLGRDRQVCGLAPVRVSCHGPPRRPDSLASEHGRGRGIVGGYQVITGPVVMLSFERAATPLRRRWQLPAVVRFAPGVDRQGPGARIGGRSADGGAGRSRWVVDEPSPSQKTIALRASSHPLSCHAITGRRVSYRAKSALAALIADRALANESAMPYLPHPGRVTDQYQPRRGPRHHNLIRLCRMRSIIEDLSAALQAASSSAVRDCPGRLTPMRSWRGRAGSPGRGPAGGDDGAVLVDFLDGPQGGAGKVAAALDGAQPGAVGVGGVVRPGPAVIGGRTCANVFHLVGHQPHWMSTQPP